MKQQKHDEKNPKKMQSTKLKNHDIEAKHEMQNMKPKYHKITKQTKI